MSVVCVLLPKSFPITNRPEFLFNRPQILTQPAFPNNLEVLFLILEISNFDPDFGQKIRF